MASFKDYITSKGKTMLANMIAGNIKIEFTKIQIGDGELLSGQKITTMEQLNNLIYEKEITSVSRNENQIIIKSIFDNSNITSGFFMREKGIFASDGTNEVLFFYANNGSNAEYIEPGTSQTIQKIMNTFCTLDDVGDINIEIRQGIYITTDEFSEEIERIDEELEVIKQDVSEKMNNNNPECNGQFSLNRKEDSEIGTYSSTFGENCTASGRSSIASGQYCTASGQCSNASGSVTHATGDYSHTEGSGTTGSGMCSHAEGGATKAIGTYSHAEGTGTIVNGYASHVQGKFNIEDTDNKYAHIIGNGISDTKRSNIHTVDWEGNAWYAGDVTNGNGVSLDGLSKRTDLAPGVASFIAFFSDEVMYALASNGATIRCKDRGFKINNTTPVVVLRGTSKNNPSYSGYIIVSKEPLELSEITTNGGLTEYPLITTANGNKLYFYKMTANWISSVTYNVTVTDKDGNQVTITKPTASISFSGKKINFMDGMGLALAESLLYY